MNAEDLRKFIGASREPVEHTPVAMLLKTGYACLGHYSGSLNEDLGQTLVVLNAQSMDLMAEANRSRPAVEDFREFLLALRPNLVWGLGATGCASAMRWVRGT